MARHFLACLSLVALSVVSPGLCGTRDEMINLALEQREQAHYKYGQSGGVPFNPATQNPWTYWKQGDGCPSGDGCDRTVDGHYVCRKDCTSYGRSGGICVGHRHFDCSGFVLWVVSEKAPALLANSGISPAYHAADQFLQWADGNGWWRSVNSPGFTWEGAELGDWVIFRSCDGNDPAQHMGIFTGRDHAYGPGDLRRYKLVSCNGSHGCNSARMPYDPGVEETTLAYWVCRSGQLGSAPPIVGSSQGVVPAGYVDLPISVPTSLTCQPPSCSCDGSAIGRATLTNAQTGGGIEGRNVQFWLDGADQGTRTTGPGGVAECDFGSFRALSPGRHVFRVEFGGEGDYEPAAPTECAFDAPYETRISCSASPARVECGQQVTLTFTLLKERGSNEFVDPVAGAPISAVAVKRGDGQAWSATGTTGSDGKWTATWPTASAGGYDVTANFGGSGCICASQGGGSFEVYATVTACKFDDRNMNGARDDGEPIIPGWPLKLYRIQGGGEVEMPAPEQLQSGCAKFTNLEAGSYRIAEDGPGITWARTSVECGGESFCDLRASYQGKRWLFTSARLGEQRWPLDTCSGSAIPSVGPFQLDCKESVSFGNVRLTSVTANVFQDCDMNGRPDQGEQPVPGWPVRLVGTRKDGKKVCYDLSTAADGQIAFPDLAPGDYTLSEEGCGIAWEKPQTVCGASNYLDWRTTWNGKRWQAAYPRPEQTAGGAAAPAVGVAVDCSPVSLDLGNVPLGGVTAFAFHDANMDTLFEPAGEGFTDSDGNGRWTPAEPFTDLNCDGARDGIEFYQDLNANGNWDAAEPFVDGDGDGQYDWPECPVPTWPFKLSGLRADGRPVCPSGSADATGQITFRDIPPSDSAGYTLTSDLPWCPVDLGWGGEPAMRATHAVDAVCTGLGECSRIDRWQATMPVVRTFVLPCDGSHSESFGNVCLTRVEGVKEVYSDGMPGQAAPEEDASGWRICLAGKDHNGRDIAPSRAECVLMDRASTPPIDIPCQTPRWFEAVTLPDGRFAFVDLLPGHYHLTEQPDRGFRLQVNRPLLCGFDLMCCPVDDIVLRNIDKSLAWKVYQAYPGDSNGANALQAGNAGLLGDAITAVPGVLRIDPGENWSNYRQSAQLCRESIGKAVTLSKQFEGFAQCSHIFTPVDQPQRGTPSIRLWWPLMYEPPTTTWTLTQFYATRTSVGFPGENTSTITHREEWKWVVDTDVEHMKLYLNLLSQLPFGQSQVPLLASGRLHAQLTTALDDIERARLAKDWTTAVNRLMDFEMAVVDACATAQPTYPDTEGPGLGIAQTQENPACCKLLLDAEHIGTKYGIFLPGR